MGKRPQHIEQRNLGPRLIKFTRNVIEEAYGFGRLVQCANVADYAADKVPNYAAKIRQSMQGPNARRREQLVTQGHHFIQCVLHPRVPFFLYGR